MPVIFATALAAVSKVPATSQAILAQWMAALWLGAQNIEQTKFLNWEDLELILGGVVRFPTPQRDQLKSLFAEVAVVDGLFQFNQENLGQSVGADFYFDPHTKHHTGEQNALKSWCPKIRFAACSAGLDCLCSATPPCQRNTPSPYVPIHIAPSLDR